MAAPDVTVIIAVYNTMPYLTECVESVLGQSIGTDRLEVVAIDDGSTDGSSAELERFAALYPKTVTVLHQENSGGPARPSNRALDLATGRYVHFLGADDHLGTEALERMVHTADAHGCDVVVGKMAGVGGRWIPPDLYRSTDLDVDLYDSELPYALANTKLFRRELVERHGLRFPEDMPVGSDQPFTIEACVRAARIAVLADYTYYYAVRRDDAGNITYRVDQVGLTEATSRIMHTTARLLEPGPRRDAIMFRHFDWDLAKCLRVPFLELDRDKQEAVCAGVAEVADAYLTDRIREGLGVQRRHRLSLAQAGAVDTLRETLRWEQERRDPAVIVDHDRAYWAYPGFRDRRTALDDRCFEVQDENLSALLSRGRKVEELSWSRGPGRVPELNLAIRLPVGGATAPPVQVCLGSKALPKHADRHSVHRLRRPGAPAPAVTGTDGARQQITMAEHSALVQGVLPIAPDVRQGEVRIRVELAGTTYEMALPGEDLALEPLKGWHQGCRFLASVGADKKGRLVVDRVALPLRQGVKRRLHKAVRGRKKQS